MLITTTVEGLSALLDPHRFDTQTIGFVPTMGALHRGHAELIETCARQCDITVCSVFVNPTQFNDARDLAAYPITPLEDEALLTAAGCDYLFRPEATEIYSGITDPTASLDFGTLTERMEGAHRPGHFTGVAQVVYRLLDIVRPHTLYLGQKDYQQVAIIRRMIELLNLSAKTVTVATVREKDGLALSSRNQRLNPEERHAAAGIHAHLATVAAGLRSGWPARELERLAHIAMSARPLLQPEYVEVVDGKTLLPYKDGDPVAELVVATAVRVGPVRLIDNVIALTANP